ncbi:MAG: hypothetical protein K2X35_03895 [Bryobacteraceae bacterium]|nr:hypothetical protein [Bryobacteraceae bacterium]
MPRLLAILLASALFAQEPYSIPAADAPELAHRGAYKAGVRTLELVNPGQPDILRFDKETKKAPLHDRKLPVEIWYPAVIADGQREHTVYTSPMPRSWPGVPPSFQFPGKALRDAPPAAGGPFPLVIVSHGYPGSRTFLTYLTENLASKGYVVAAIDHTDSVFGATREFASTLLNRSKDQWFAIEEIGRLARQPGHFLNGLVDASRAAITGYSMGGYGALASAGAGYSSKSAVASLVPGGYLEELLAGNAGFTGRNRAALKAIVAIAPWGAQPPINSWDPEGLAAIRIPALFIAGDQDDVSGFEQGTRKAFEGAVNSDRYLLVYENARHNTGGNPAPPEARSSFAALAFFDEPVWRKDRIAAINQHFITAFLDLHLKGDVAKRAYLEVPERTNGLKWNASPGQPDSGGFSSGADSGGNRYWKGFQRRWAVGLQMLRGTPAQ